MKCTKCGKVHADGVACLSAAPHRVSVSFDPAQVTARLSAAADAEGGRPTRILGTAFAIGAPSGPSSDGYRYQFAAMPENADELLDVVNEHDGWADPIGRLAEPLAPTADGTLAAANARIFDTTAGRDALVLAAEGVKGGFSIAASFDSFDQDEQGIRHVPTWRAEHLGVVRSPAFTESRGLTLAASAASTNEGDTVKCTKCGKVHAEGVTACQSADLSGPPAPPAGAAFGEIPTVQELARQVAELNAEAGRQGAHPLAQYPTHAEFAAAFLGADEDERRRLSAAFAVPTETTAEIPGLMVPAWRSRLIANLDARRPAIQAFGGSQGLPDGGMSVEWPFFNGDLDAMIAQQLAELDSLSGVQIRIEKGSEDILTAGAAASISYQALLRSSPAFLAQYQAIMDAAWARYTEAVFELSIQAKATAMGAASLPAIVAGDKPTALKSLLFDASAQVEDATGAPANVVLVSSDIWKELGGADLPNPKEGPGNGTGTSDASTLTVSINGLQPKRAPFLGAGTMVVSNDSAAKFSEQGPMLAAEEDVVKLGRTVATWGMYIPSEVYYPAGVLKYTRA